MAFDPKAFLAETSSDSSGFDPKAFLAETSASNTPAKASAPADNGYDPYTDYAASMGMALSPTASKAAVKGAKSYAVGLAGGVTGLLPNEYGGTLGPDLSSQANAAWKEAVNADPVAARMGYYGTQAIPMLAGGVASALFKAPAAVSEIATLGSSVLKGMGIGGGYGVLSGALSPSTEKNYTKRLKGKGIDALIGGGLGATLGIAIPLVGSGVNAVNNYLSTALGRKATQAELDLVQKAKDLADGKIKSLSAEDKRLAQHMRDSLDRKEATAKVLDATYPEDIVAQEQARKIAGLPNPTTGEQIAVNKHVEGQLRPLAERSFEAAEKVQAEEGGKPFRRYLEVANNKQSIQPFGLSPEGKALESELDTLIQGGSGELKNVSADEAATAKRLKEALYPQSKEAPSNIDPELASQLEAAGVLPGTQAGRQVDFGLVDRELRHLRDLQEKKAIEGFTGTQKREIKGVADRLEAAMKRWVGEENYARGDYAEASRAYNAWKTKFGEKLTGKQEIPYSSEGGVYQTPEGQLGQHVFRDRDSVKFAQRLMGETQVNQLAEQYATDKLKGLGAKEARAWLDNPNNAFVDAVPGLRKKLGNYAARLEEHEAGGVRLKGLQNKAEREYRDLERQVDAISSSMKDIAKRSGSLTEDLNTLNSALSSKARQDAAAKLVGTLKSELPPDQHAQAELLVEKLKTAIDKRNKARTVVIGTAATSAVGVPLGGWAARRAASSLLGTD